MNPDRTIKSLSDKEFELYWKAIETNEKWEVGEEDFIEKCYIAGVVFAPVAPENAEKLSLHNLCMPDKRQKLLATQISILHPLDRESVMRMATVYDRNVFVSE